MAVSVRGRSTMALYSSETSLDCHRVRFVLAEKGINVDIVNVSVDESAAADLADVEISSGFDSISLMPTLTSNAEDQAEHEYLYWDYGHVRDEFKQAVRFGNWKSVRNAWNSPLELYDLEKDPSESKDISQDHPEVVKQAEKYLVDAFVESPDYPIVSKNP